MPVGAFPFGGVRKVLVPARAVHVSGGGTMPSGAMVGISDSGSTPPVWYYTGPGWAGTTRMARSYGPCAVSAVSLGPEAHEQGYDLGDGDGPYPVYATIGGGGGFAVAVIHSRAFHGQLGRGATGDTVDFSYDFSFVAETVEYVQLGEPDAPDPDPRYQYPAYGGARVAGEHPTERSVVVLEAVAGTTMSGTVTIGGESAGFSVTVGDAQPVLGGNSEITLGHAPLGPPPVGDPAPGTRPYVAGILTADLHDSGTDLTSETRSKTYTLGGTFVASGEVGAGFIRAKVNTANETGEVSGEATAQVHVVGSYLPPRVATLTRDAVLADGSPYPESVEWRAVLGYKSASDDVDADGYHALYDPPLPVTTTLVGQAVSAEIRQVRETVGVTTNGKTYDSVTKAGTWVPVRGYLASGQYVSLEHWVDQQGPVAAWRHSTVDADWRVPTLGRAEAALTVAHDGTLSVPLPSRVADGDDTLYTFAAPFVSEGYRFAAATGSATSLTVNAGKSFGLSSYLDWCFATNRSGAYDLQNTRWPLDASRLSTVDTPYWGVSVLRTVRAVGGTLDSLTLRATTVRQHWLAPLAHTEYEVPDDEGTTSDGDTYPVRHRAGRIAVFDVDGRQGHELPHVRMTDNHAPGRAWVTDYSHLSIAALVPLVHEVPGWHATLASIVDRDDRAWYLGGWIRAGGAWSRNWDLPPGGVRLQPRIDWVEWPGSPGDLYGTGGGAGLVLAGRWTARGQAYGALKSDATVHASNDDGSGEVTQASSGKRYGLLGPPHVVGSPWGRVWVDAAHKAEASSVPRMIQRIAFGVAVARLIAAAVSRGWRHARATDRDGLALDFSPNVRPFPFSEGTGHDALDWVTLAYPTQGRGDPLTAFYGPHGGAATFALLHDEGSAPMPQFTVASADYGAHCFAPNGALYLFRLSGGTVYGRAYDVGLHPLGPEWATTLSGVDDAPIAASCSVGSGGELRVHLQHFAAGSLVFATSPDGKTFS